MFGLQIVVVDPQHHGNIGAVGRSRDHHPLGPGFKVLGRGLALGEDAGAFERHIDAQPAPRQFRRVALGGDRDPALADIHPPVAGGDLAREAAVHAVVAQQMRVGPTDPRSLIPTISMSSRRLS